MSKYILKKIKNTRKLHLVTFGSANFKKSKFRLEEQAKNTNWFDSINCYSDESIFLKQYKKPMSGRVAGYGWWKPAIILEILRHIEENDIVLYLDAGCNIIKENKKKFLKYLEFVCKNNILCFSGRRESFDKENTDEKKFTKKDLFVHLNCDNEYYYPYQYSGNHFFIVNNTIGTTFLQNYLKVFDNINLANDSPSIYSNYPEFIEHRHDQSILSLLYKKTGLIGLTDEADTWLQPNGPIGPFSVDRITDSDMDYLEWPNNAFTLDEIRKLVYKKRYEIWKNNNFII